MEQICFEEEDYNRNWDIWNSSKLIGTTELRVLDEKYKEWILLTNKFYYKNAPRFKKIVLH